MLVVGAGPAGCAAAIVLARAGVDVAMVDRAQFPRDKTCGDAVSNGAMALLDGLGAGEDVRAGAHALVHRGAAIFPDGTRIDRGYAQPGYLVTRLRLDDCIRRAAERAGVRVIEGARVATLRMRDGMVCGADGPQLDWSARLVIAADGYGSVGLPALDRPAPRGRHLGVASTLYCRGVRFPYGSHTADHFFERELPFGYAWIFPEVDGIANIGVYQRQDAYRHAGRPLAQVLEDFIVRHPDRLASIERVGKPHTWSLPLAPAPWPASGRGILLAGDAGGFVDPLIGEGIWQALFSGMTAGQVAADAIKGPGVLTAELCERFEAECDEHIGRPSRGKAIGQLAMRWLVGAGLYHAPPVRAALRWAYTRRSFEMTKS